jgi:hypothetical protein
MIQAHEHERSKRAFMDTLLLWGLIRILRTKSDKAKTVAVLPACARRGLERCSDDVEKNGQPAGMDTSILPSR